VTYILLEILLLEIFCDKVTSAYLFLRPQTRNSPDKHELLLCSSSYVATYTRRKTGFLPFQCNWFMGISLLAYRRY